MNFYRQSIILFGLVLPALFGVALVAAGYFIKSKMETTYEDRKRSFSEQRKASLQCDAIEKIVKADRPHLVRWEEQLAQETASAVVSNLKEITDTLPDKEIQRTAFDPSNNESGFGAASAQKASTIRIQFRGTYRTLQKALLQLETRMPQLQLEEMSMSPVSTSSYQMNLQLGFTAWEK